MDILGMIWSVVQPLLTPVVGGVVDLIGQAVQVKPETSLEAGFTWGLIALVKKWRDKKGWTFPTDPMLFPLGALIGTCVVVSSNLIQGVDPSVALSGALMAWVGALVGQNGAKQGQEMFGKK